MDRKEYIRDYQRKWIANRRAKFFKDKVCKCGSTESLQIDHVDPKTKVSHRVWSWSKERFDEEIKKCQILCHECHKEKTRLWNLSRRKHGRTWYSYGCRCEICFKAQQKHNAQRNANVAQLVRAAVS